MKLVLYNGNRYEEVIPKKATDKERIPHAKVYFEEYEMNIDLSKFNNVDLEEENYKSTFRMQKIDQLRVSIDTLQISFSEEQDAFSENFGKQSVLTQNAKKSTPKAEQDSLPPNLFEFIISNEIWKKSRVMDESIVKVRSSIRNLNTKKNTFFAYQKTINLHKITLN